MPAFVNVGFGFTSKQSDCKITFDTQFKTALSYFSSPIHCYNGGCWLRAVYYTKASDNNFTIYVIFIITERLFETKPPTFAVHSSYFLVFWVFLVFFCASSKRN